MAILNIYKAQLGELIAQGLARFGKVAPRRPYRDDEGGDGAPGLSIETHPLLANLPVGAASDLTFIASENSAATEEALNRVEELSPSLQNQPALQAELTYNNANRHTPKPTPYG